MTVCYGMGGLRAAAGRTCRRNTSGEAIVVAPTKLGSLVSRRTKRGRPRTAHPVFGLISMQIARITLESGSRSW